MYAKLALKHQFCAPLLFGFACGGIMHLLADWPNPTGIPWIAGRHSLKLWKSGECGMLAVVPAWITAFVAADHVFFNSALLHKMTALAASLRATWLI